MQEYEGVHSQRTDGSPSFNPDRPLRRAESAEVRGINLEQFTARPGWRGLNRNKRTRLVDVNNGVKLRGDVRLEIVAPALGFRPVNDADRPLEQFGMR